MLKQKRFTTVASMFLVITMLLSLFGACGSGTTVSTVDSIASAETSERSETEEAPSESEATTDLGSYPLADGDVTLSLWTVYPPPMAMAVDNDLSQIAVVKTARETTGVNLDVRLIGMNVAAEQFGIASASGEWTDIIWGVDWYANSLSGALEDGIAIAINDYLEYAPNYAALLDSDPVFAKEARLDSGDYPGFYGRSSDSLIRGLQIRQDYLDKVNKEIPHTIDELEDVLLAFKNELGVKYPVYASVIEVMYGPLFLAEAYGVDGGWCSSDIPFYIDEDGKTVKCSWLEDGFKKYIETAHNWYAEGILTQDNCTFSETENYIISGEAGMWRGEVNLLSETYAESAIDAENFNAVGMPMVTEKEGDSIHFETATPTETLWCISSCCDDPALAASYIDYYFSEAGTVAANYGIEGEGFTYEDGVPTYTELVTHNPDGLDSSVAQAVYSSFWIPHIEDPNRNNSLYCDAQINAIDAFNQHVDGTQLYHGSMTVDETAEYSGIASDIITQATEMIPKFILGDLPMDEYDAFIESLQDLNIARTLELKQSAFERYLVR